ncbi:Uu.00g027730.m01.CDS01 [Anthostomella pinea]|uniref:Uu.00g027730.m01.CDS01 n=1 Tax=Anthostomella pinea TaxID=933095 RepID=A0AAI8YCP4_9PEZI|nr:Uu.00g027730.m01.CDS01 [Anthostomella pinea]
MSTPTEKSAEAGNRGNGCYRKGLFDQATKAYFEALRLAPNHHAPLGNLAAVQFELGNYTISALYSEKALRLLNDVEDIDPRKQKLILRLARAYALSSGLDNATTAVARLAPGAEKEAMESCVAMQPPPQDVTNLRTKVLDEVPRTKPAWDEPEFYAVGHDNAEAVYDDAIAPSTSQELSWMFAGVGDARNFYRTLIAIPNGEDRTGRKRRYHFTLLDLKPTVFARNLVILELLSDFESILQAKEALACLIYVFGCQIMPPFAYTKLQETIATVLRKLDGGKPVASWIYVAESQHAAIRHHLSVWQQNLRGKYCTSKFRRDDEVFDKFGFMVPKDALLREHESELSKLLDDYKRGNKGASKAIEEYIDNHWRPNVTLVDGDFQDIVDPDGILGPEMPMHPVLLFHKLHPAEVEDTVHAAGGGSFMQCFEVFFRCGAFSLYQLQSRITDETVVGELNDCLERLRYDALQQQHESKQGTMDPNVFPKTYDRIHLSNIPDYDGCPLSSFLYTMPVLKAKSSLSACVLLNNHAFDDYQHLLSEYTLLDNLKSIEDNFRVELREDSPSIRDWEEMEMSDYTNWAKVSPSVLALEKRMSKGKLENFIHRHLLKVLLPYKRDPLDGECVLIAHLHSVGYPGHWLSSVLEGIFEGTFTTTVRAPRQAVDDPGSVTNAYPSATISIKPWLAELATLGTIWQSLLPFGLLIPNSLLPSRDSIRKYTISFPPGDVEAPHRPHFVLVFWSQAAAGAPPTSSGLRQTLLDDEQGDRSEKARSVRESGIRVLTTYKWVTKTATASFWLRSDEVEMMMREAGSWSAAVWRVDSWERVTAWVGVSEKIVEGEGWVD